MNKYTINKVSEKAFSNPIWKIEVDCLNQYIAVESRNLTDTLPQFSVYTFDGKDLLNNYAADDKEWGLAGIQDEFIILKKYGSSAPIQAGIRIIHFPSGYVVADYAEYILQEIKKDFILATHRSIASGLSFKITISEGKVSHLTNGAFSGENYPNNVFTPRPYLDIIPPFLPETVIKNQLWCQNNGNLTLWTYLEEKYNKFVLKTVVIKESNLLAEVEVLNNLKKLIHQPYFAVDNYIFFLSETKQEIITYLV